MSECPRDDMRDRLPDLLHERLDPATRAEVARHVASCAACAEELELLRSMRRVLSTAPQVDAARIAAALAASRAAAPAEPNVRQLAPRAAPRAGRRAAWRIAAALVIAALGVSGWLLVHRLPGAPALPVAAAPSHVDSTAAAPTVVAARPRGPGHSHAVAAPPVPPSLLASRPGLVMDGGVTDLSDGDMRMLLQSLDSLSAVPDADPAPMSYQIDDGGVQ